MQNILQWNASVPHTEAPTETFYFWVVHLVQLNPIQGPHWGAVCCGLSRVPFFLLAGQPLVQCGYPVPKVSTHYSMLQKVGQFMFCYQFMKWLWTFMAAFTVFIPTYSSFLFRCAFWLLIRLATWHLQCFLIESNEIKRAHHTLSVFLACTNIHSYARQ